MNTRSPEHASNQVALLGPAEIRDLAEQLDLQPTKKLGQNFVHDPNTVRMIVSSADVTADDSIVEIGPGLGSLTLALLELGAQVTAVEIDERLAQKLPHTVHDRAESVEDHLTIIHKDALQVTQEDFTQAGVPEPTALVANLPYNVSVPVLLHFLEEFPSIRRVLVMVQDEVADRLAATPGSKVYGVPSVKASYYGTVSKAGKIGKNVFWPAPKIDSGLVRIDMHDPTHAWTVDPEQRGTLFPIIDAAFGQRRKTLRAALSGYFGSAGRAEEALRIAGISPQQRGEKLSVEDFIRLADAAYDLAAAQGDQNED